MTDDLVPLKHISEISAYVAGKVSSDAERDTFKLSSNESPWGPAPGVKKVVRESLDVLNRYPACQPYKLRQSIAVLHGLSSDNVILGNGSNEVIQFLISAFAGTKKDIIIPEVSFSMYRIYAEIAGSSVKTVPMQGLSVDLEAIKKRIGRKTGIIFLTSPNNPTGTILPKEELQEFIKAVPGSVVVVIDEAYADFCEKRFRLNIKDLIGKNKFQNIVILRTFSKLYGLAALRIGYGLSSPFIIENLNKVRQHFNTNHLGNIAAGQALAEKLFYDSVIAQTVKGREYLEEKFREMGFPVISSYANFVTLKVRDGCLAEKILHRDGFIVRELTSFKMADYLRITVDKPAVNKSLVESFIRNLKKIKPL